MPDYVFGLRQSSTGRERYYFLEFDNGTMPVKRRDNRQTSYFRKILCYADTLENNIAHKRFGIAGFQVLTVTTSEKRIASIQRSIASISERKFSANTFLFRSKDDPQAALPFYGRWMNLNNAPVDLF